jgi:transcriptional regulator with XRE-family HTH domain
MAAIGDPIGPKSPPAKPGSLEATPDRAIANVIARRLIWYRRLRRLTQTQVAENAGLSRSALNAAEGGQVHITIRTLYLLAAALGTDACVLLGYEDPPAELQREDAERRRF